jgi:hypothetical protein
MPLHAAVGACPFSADTPPTESLCNIPAFLNSRCTGFTNKEYRGNPDQSVHLTVTQDVA